MVKSEKIKENQIYTYKELCQLFDEPLKNSDSKVAQLKEWRRYFRWSNPTRQKYKIEEIYDAPLEKQDNRKNNGGNCTSKYLALDDFIMEFMEEKQNIVCTMSGLLVGAGMLSEEYIINRWEHWKYKDSDFSKGVVNHVFWKMESVVNAGKSSLARLEKEGYLSVVKRIVLISPFNEKITLAERKSQTVEEIKACVKKDMDLQPNDLFKQDIRKKYEAEVIERIEAELNVQVKYYYRVYDISITDKVYFRKTAEDRKTLTRKFVKAICLSMLKINFRKGFYWREDKVIQTVRLMNRLFQHMTDDNWDEYFMESPESKLNEADAIFWLLYCEPYQNWRLERDRKAALEAEGQEESMEHNDEKAKLLVQALEQAEREAFQKQGRLRMVEHFGEEQTQEFESIIPNLDWGKVFKENDEQRAYLQYAEHFLNIYYETINKMFYMPDSIREKRSIIENVMNDAIQHYKEINAEKAYSWLEDLEPTWKMKDLNILCIRYEFDPKSRKFVEVKQNDLINQEDFYGKTNDT